MLVTDEKLNIAVGFVAVQPGTSDGWTLPNTGWLLVVLTSVKTEISKAGDVDNEIPTEKKDKEDKYHDRLI